MFHQVRSWTSLDFFLDLVESPLLSIGENAGLSHLGIGVEYVSVLCAKRRCLTKRGLHASKETQLAFSNAGKYLKRLTCRHTLAPDMALNC